MNLSVALLLQYEAVVRRERSAVRNGSGLTWLNRASFCA